MKRCPNTLLAKKNNLNHDCFLNSSPFYKPEDHIDDEEGGALGDGGIVEEERVESVEQHGNHHHVHGVPVGVPPNLHHPLSKIQVKSADKQFPF